jgi:hypothetical protein
LPSAIDTDTIDFSVGAMICFTSAMVATMGEE